MVPGGGIEPPTRGFSIHCSTPELPGRRPPWRWLMQILEVMAKRQRSAAASTRKPSQRCRALSLSSREVSSARLQNFPIYYKCLRELRFSSPGQKSGPARKPIAAAAVSRPIRWRAAAGCRARGATAAIKGDRKAQLPGRPPMVSTAAMVGASVIGPLRGFALNSVAAVAVWFLGSRRKRSCGASVWSSRQTQRRSGSPAERTCATRPMRGRPA